MKVNLLKLGRGERVTDVSSYHLSAMQSDGSCDHCSKKLPSGTRVLGKIVSIQKGIVLSTLFSPTCLQCVNMN